MSLQMETPRRPPRSRRGSRTPFNPLKSRENSMDIFSLQDQLDNGSVEEFGIKIRTEPFENHYTVEDNLGRGKFATVKRCVCKETGKMFAAKVQRKRRKAKDARHELLHEVRMLATCRVHPRFVSIREVFETRHEMIIVTDYAEGGELYRHVEERESGFAETEVKHLMRQTLEGLAFLHDRSIVHMDIKPQNILLSDNDVTSGILLCDLGFSRDVTSGEDIREIIGTPDFVAPEILNYEPLTTNSDMWSVGVLTYMLLTGYSPFAGDNKMETFSNITQANVEFPEDWFKNVSQEAQEFICKLLVRNPCKRLSAHECLEHTWLEEEEESCDLNSQSSDSRSQSCDLSRGLSSQSSIEDSCSTDSMEKVDTIVTKSAISHISIELVKKKLETLVEQENLENCDSVEKSGVEKSDENCDSNVEKCAKDSEEKESTGSNKIRKLSCDLSDTTNQRKALKELSNQRTASVVQSPLASPIGCRRTLTPSPETILEIEPIKKHHCRRDSQEVSLILKTDLQVLKVESKVWDLGEIVFEDNSAVVSKREKEVVVTTS